MDPSKQKRKFFIVSRNKELQEFVKEIIEPVSIYEFEFVDGLSSQKIPVGSLMIYVGKNQDLTTEQLGMKILSLCNQINYEGLTRPLSDFLSEEIIKDTKKSLEVASRHIETLKMNDFQRFGKGDRKKNKSNFKKQFRR